MIKTEKRNFLDILFTLLPLNYPAYSFPGKSIILSFKSRFSTTLILNFYSSLIEAQNHAFNPPVKAAAFDRLVGRYSLVKSER